MKLQNVRLQDGKLKLGELTGGKLDDITVLVAMVEEYESVVLQPSTGHAPQAEAVTAGMSNGDGHADMAPAGEAAEQKVQPPVPVSVS